MVSAFRPWHTMRAMKRVHRTRDDWLSAALDALERDGEESVRITALARELGVSRSGFYWHFRDRAELLEALIDFWEREYTTVVIRQLAGENLGPRERLLAVADRVVLYDFTRFDPSMLAWARRDATLARRIAKSFRTRERYTATAFEELGFKGKDLKVRTHAFVAAISAECLMFPQTSKREGRKIAKAIAEILTKR